MFLKFTAAAILLLNVARVNRKHLRTVLSKNIRGKIYIFVFIFLMPIKVEFAVIPKCPQPVRHDLP